MKTIFTLLVSVLTITTAFAQTNAQKEEAKRVILGEKSGSTSGDDRTVILGGDNRTVYGERNRRYPEKYPTAYGGSADREINEINRTYDAKLYFIRNNRVLSAIEKERIIRQLEADRRRRVNEINDRYNSRNGYDGGDDYKKYKKNTGNNGNHYGWQKGKGNPHAGKY